jgi:hypothetical protein
LFEAQIVAADATSFGIKARLEAELTRNMVSSHPDEWLHQATDQTVQPKITLHCDQANAISARIDHHLMIHAFVAYQRAWRMNASVDQDWADPTAKSSQRP